MAANRWSDVPYGMLRLYCALLCLLFTNLPCLTQQLTKPKGSEPVAEPATHAVLAAFDKYELVAMPAGHGLKDLDDFILSLIRNPAFPDKVDDIVVECGNSLYQPIVDRYIAGKDVPFTEVRQVWRTTITGPMCGTSGFYEQLFPLIRAINEKLPAGKRLRVLAADPPIDWSKIKTSQDVSKFLDRDGSIAAVMEKEVLSRRRRALMLFGTSHLMHGVNGLSAVSLYEQHYPNITFVIAELGTLDFDLAASSGPVSTWPLPALLRAKGTWLGALDVTHFYPGSMTVDKNCKPQSTFPKDMQKPMADLVDAFLYVAPQHLRLREQLPADIALDSEYMSEMIRRAALQGFPGAATTTVDQFLQQTIRNAERPLFDAPKPATLDVQIKSCLDTRTHSTPLK